MEGIDPNQPPRQRFPSKRQERVLMVVILLVATFVRLWHLDLMEFKADEAEACRLAYHVFGDPLADGDNQFPLAGLTSSIGVRNPPFFIYVLALPLAISRSPLAAVVFIALCNVVAVWLCHRVGRRYFSTFVGLAAAALYAMSPWAIIYSRKIWAQDLLPVFVGLFLLAAHHFLVDKKPRMVAWLVVLAGVAIQLNFSALVLLGVLAFVLFAGRETFRWRWFCVGVAISFLLFGPYFFYLITTHGGDFTHLADRQQQWAGNLSLSARLLLSARYTFAVSSVDATEFLTAIPWRFALPLSLATGTACVVGLVWQCVRDRAGPLFRARLMLLIWFALPVLGVAVVGALPFPHYFIILYPLPFLGLAVALEKVVERWRWWGGVLLGAFLVGYALFDGAIFRSLATRGGSVADYGVAYTYKAAAMDFILAENHNTPFILHTLTAPGEAVTDLGAPDPAKAIATNFVLTGNGDLSFIRPTDFNFQTVAPLEYMVLLWSKMSESHWSPSAAEPTRAYVLMDTFSVSLSPEGERMAQGLRRLQFGPLTVFVVPLPPKTG